ncbi:hypothetical protein PHMEG_00020918, partial [Phytophthora megakarya]
MDAQAALARSFVMVAMTGDILDADPAVYNHQGSDFVLLSMLKNQLAYLLDLSDLPTEANIEDAIVGLGRPVSQGTEPRGAVVSRTSTDTVFHQNRVTPKQMGPVLSRSSYIDDI